MGTKERFKIYFGVAGARARKVAFRRVRFDVIAILLVASLGVGVLLGFVQARGFDILTDASNRVQKTFDSWAATPEPATPEPALALPLPEPSTPEPVVAPPPPVRRPPAARPAVKPGPVVSTPAIPSTQSTSARSGSRPVVSAATPVFRVQVGAFRIRANAEVLVQKLSRDGFKASINQTSDLYKVQIGKFSNRRDATRLAAQLKAKRYAAFVTQVTTSSR